MIAEFIIYVICSLDRFMVYVPVAVHDPLRSAHDDSFFKLCRMRGIVFDAQNKIGTLFLLVDSIVGGAISFICVSRSKIKALELTVQVLTFVIRNFGVDTGASESRNFENVTNMLANMKKVLKKEKINQAIS